MTIKLGSFCMLAIPFVCLGIMGCSEADVPLDPIGQFDDGTYEIFDPAGVLIGAIYAHHDLIDIKSSYEYWKLDPASGAMSCNEKSNCDLTGKIIKPSITTKFGDFAGWRDNKAYTFNNPWYLRATYSDHKATTDFSCNDSTCKYLPANDVPTTPISIFPLGTYEYERDIVVVTNSPSGVVETWFMAAFFATSSRPTDGISFTHAASADLPCGVACAAPCGNECSSKYRVDVQYATCRIAPTSTTDCQQ